jgi:hypothetical protein
MMVKSLDAKAAIRAMLSLILALPIYYFTDVAIQMRPKH